VLGLARKTGVTALAAVERPPSVVVGLDGAASPSGWGSNAAGYVVPDGAGTLQVPVQVPSAGRYSLWLGGSFRDRLEVLVDGRRVETIRNQLNNSGQYTPVGSADLSSGAHTVTLRYGGPDLMPGSGGAQFPIGPLVLSRTTAATPVTVVSPDDAKSLCAQNLDWVEALGT
jgi:hypothetical protein